jgi:hypothetical protein
MKKLKILLAILHGVFIVLLVINYAMLAKQTLAITNQNNLLRETSYRCARAEEAARLARRPCETPQ